MKPDLDAIRARCDAAQVIFARNSVVAPCVYDDIPALLAYVDDLEGRTSYTVGETEWAHRIANAEERALTAEERLERVTRERDQERKVFERAMAEAQTDVRELRARIAELERM